jgi:hypothetical protein
MAMVHHDAELRDWAVCRIDRFVVLVGRIFADKKQRWPDGRLIQSSPLLTPFAANEGNVVATLNSHYLLVGPRRSLRDAMALIVILHLDEAQSIEIAKVFAKPPQPNKALRELGRSKPPWA